MWKTRIVALLVLLAAFGIGWFVYASEQAAADGASSKYAFRLGLDLKGGTTLTYRADVSRVAPGEVRGSMDALRDVIERRVNLFGVSEPNVQSQEANFTNGDEYRLIVDLPGVTDIAEAIEMIGQTPLLEFRTEGELQPGSVTVDEDGTAVISDLDLSLTYVPTELTGRYLQRASLQFDQMTGVPHVALQFNKEGAELFERITRENIGKTVAIYLDGAPISTPVVQQAIAGGEAVISGSMNAAEARTLVGRLNSGALPVPIELVSTATIGATLGDAAVQSGVRAGLIGFLLIAIFLVLWYRLPGLVAVAALSIYTTLMLALFKLVPVTLTAPGIAGFIISLGTAVDGNILIFERIKEEIRDGQSIPDAVKAGFSRAWFSIRDANTASIITGIILFVLGTALMKGFALTLVIGMVVSLFSAITITRLFLFALRISRKTPFTRFLFGSGISNAGSAESR